MPEVKKYLTQTVALDEEGNEITLHIRDTEIWDYINSQGGQFEVIVMATLPNDTALNQPNPDNPEHVLGADYYGKIFLTNESGSGSNMYDEYIVQRSFDGSTYTYRWEKIGSTSVNMDGYSVKGHIHQVTPQTSVADHIYTPEGTLSITLKLATPTLDNPAEGTTQVVKITGTPKGQVKLEETTQQEYNGEGSTHNILELTPSGTIDADVDESGQHTHDIEKMARTLKRTDVELEVNDTKKFLDRANIETFTIPTNEQDKVKASLIDMEDSGPIAHVVGNTTPIPTVDTSKTTSLTIEGNQTGNFVTGLVAPSTGDTPDVVEKAVASAIEGQGASTDPDSVYYTLSFTRKKFEKGSALSSLGTPTWDSTAGAPIGVNAFGTNNIPTIENYHNQNGDAISYKLIKRHIPVVVPKPTTEGTLDVVTGLADSGVTNDAVVVSVTGEGSASGLLTCEQYQWLSYFKVTNKLASRKYICPHEDTLVEMDAFEEMTEFDSQYPYCYFLYTGSPSSNATTNAVWSTSSHKFNGSSISSNQRAIIQAKYENSKIQRRYRSYESNSWSDWVESTPSAPTGWYVSTKNNQGFIGTIYGVKAYKRSTDELIYNGVPALEMSSGKVGLYDKVTGSFLNYGIPEDGKVEAGTVLNTDSASNVTIVSEVSGLTSAAGLHTHALDNAEFEGNPQYIKGTFIGTANENDSSDTKLQGTTSKTTVDTQTFVGTQATISHTVYNPTVFTSPDDDGTNHAADWYGISYNEIDDVVPDNITRIGNIMFHKSLPIHSQMRRCLLLDDGTVNYYLDANDSTKKTDGTAAVLDGTDGQVMVEVPRHWRRVTKDEENNIAAMVSPYRQDGWIEVPKYYMSAYEAALDRTTLKLASVVNATARFRGGDNTSAWDGTDRSLLGRPATYLSLAQFRNYARARGNDGEYKWNVMPYDLYLDLYWLYVIEYANRNSQAAFNGTLTLDGYRQGGLGSGVTECNPTAAGNWNDKNPFVPCGYTNSLGNTTGVVSITLPSGYTSDTGRTQYVPSWRGLENPFGHILKFADGIKIFNHIVYRTNDQSKYSSESNINNYTSSGLSTTTSGYVKALIIGPDGDIFPSSVDGGGSTSYYCDQHYAHGENRQYTSCMIGGYAYQSNSQSAQGGMCYTSEYQLINATLKSCGTRLCYCDR